MKTNNSKRGRLKAAIIITAALVIGAAAGTVVTAKTRLLNGGGAIVPKIVVAASPPVPNGNISFASGFAPIIPKVVPAVVNISSTKVIDSRMRLSSPIPFSGSSSATSSSSSMCRNSNWRKHWDPG